MSKVPDKIYIPGEWLCIPKNHFETEDSPGATEYIRKDLILEWCRDESKYWDNGDIMFREIIRKINML